GHQGAGADHGCDLRGGAPVRADGDHRCGAGGADLRALAGVAREPDCADGGALPEQRDDRGVGACAGVPAALAGASPPSLCRRTCCCRPDFTAETQRTQRGKWNWIGAKASAARTSNISAFAWSQAADPRYQVCFVWVCDELFPELLAGA